MKKEANTLKLKIWLFYHGKNDNICLPFEKINPYNDIYKMYKLLGVVLKTKTDIKKRPIH